MADASEPTEPGEGPEEQPDDPSAQQPDEQPAQQPDGVQSQQVQMQSVTARVPDAVSAGVFSTGSIVMTGPNEFVVDFIQNLGQPAQLAARVIVPHAVMPQFIGALEQNIQVFQDRHGAIPVPAAPAPPAKAPPSPQEIYEELKSTDDVMTGAYANGMMIGHSQTEFRIDFLGNMFPKPMVTCRVFMSAPQIPKLLDSLKRTMGQLRKKDE